MNCLNSSRKRTLFLGLTVYGILAFAVIYFMYGAPTGIYTKVSSNPLFIGPDVRSFTVNTTTGSTTARPDACSDCFKNEFALKVNGKKICAPSNHTIKLLILISSAVKNSHLRDAIRETWASMSSRNTGEIRYVFLFGRSSDASLNGIVDTENDIHGDVVVSDFVDSYRNLTIKTLVGMKWATTYCSRAQNVMKTDDDSWVNTLRITGQLGKWGLNNTLVGQCMNGRPHRNPSSKWFVRPHEYPHDSYPTFCSGTGYVTSMNVVRQIVDVSRNIPFFYLEDVYVGVCLRKLGLNAKGASGFHLDFVRPLKCTYKSKNIITSHHMKPDLLRKIWAEKCPD